MKVFFAGICTTLIIGFTGYRALAEEDFRPTVIVQRPDFIFTPMGFDNNDNTQIVLYGNLPDTCHKVGTVRTRVNKQQRTIYVRNEILFYRGAFCADVLVPYTTTVNVGVLRQGNYDVVVEGEDGSFEKMAGIPIAVATSANPDDYLYAPVDHVHFNKGDGSGPPELALSGNFTNSCMRLKDIKVTYRQNHVIEVQPIADLEKGNCGNELRPFHGVVQIKPGYQGKVLIHVRSLNGQSINQVVSF